MMYVRISTFEHGPSFKVGHSYYAGKLTKPNSRKLLAKVNRWQTEEPARSSERRLDQLGCLSLGQLSP
jgi:hypothetical protein